MSILQLKRGTTTQVNNITPAVGELVLDLTTNRLRVGDGSTEGGNPLNVEKATKLATARNIKIQLDSTTGSDFDGSSDVTPGVAGVLPVANGGTGGNDAATARSGIGAAASGVNNDITKLSGLTLPSPLPGVTDASSAAAGKIGQMIEANASAVSVTSGTVTNIVSITLPAGEWDVYGELQLVSSASGVMTNMTGGISTTSATDAGFPYKTALYFNNNASVAQFPTPRRFLQLSATTTVFLVASTVFGSGTCAAAGYIHARRVR